MDTVVVWSNIFLDCSNGEIKVHLFRHSAHLIILTDNTSQKCDFSGTLNCIN